MSGLSEEQRRRAEENRRKALERITARRKAEQQQQHQQRQVQCNKPLQQNRTVPQSAYACAASFSRLNPTPTASALQCYNGSGDTLRQTSPALKPLGPPNPQSTGTYQSHNIKTSVVNNPHQVFSQPSNTYNDATSKVTLNAPKTVPSSCSSFYSGSSLAGVKALPHSYGKTNVSRGQNASAVGQPWLNVHTKAVRQASTVRPTEVPACGGVKGTCVLISRNRFEVRVGYSTSLIDLFKSMETKHYGECLLLQILISVCILMVNCPNIHSLISSLQFS